MVHKGVLRAFLVRIYPFLHTKIYNKLILFAIRTQLPLTWTWEWRYFRLTRWVTHKKDGYFIFRRLNVAIVLFHDDRMTHPRKMILWLRRGSVILRWRHVRMTHFRGWARWLRKGRCLRWLVVASIRKGGGATDDVTCQSMNSNRPHCSIRRT